jgi:hypothetical protein
MLFFFILPVWFLCLIAGFGILLSQRLRFLSAYLLLGSTCGLLLSFVLSLGVLLLTGKFLGGTSVAWLALVAYLVGIAIEGTIGVLLGLFLARTLNRRLGWQ